MNGKKADVLIDDHLSDSGYLTVWADDVTVDTFFAIAGVSRVIKSNY